MDRAGGNSRLFHGETMTDRFSLSGRVALVTGASRGLGLAMAEALADHGALVLINGRTQSSLAEAARRISGGSRRIETAVFDVSDPQASRSGIDAIVKAH